MDYAEEQTMEIEALQAILMDDLKPYDLKRPSVRSSPRIIGF